MWMLKKYFVILYLVLRLELLLIMMVVIKVGVQFRRQACYVKEKLKGTNINKKRLV